MTEKIPRIPNLTFTLHVGDTPGYRSIEVRINWSNRSSETNNGNNSVATSINVRDFDYEMSVDDVTMSGNYCAGETVISSFTVSNDSDYDITPDMGNSASFTAYYFSGSLNLTAKLLDFYLSLLYNYLAFL